MKYRSVFDIIGPIMVGPSSSHTAGAVAIGRIARKLFGRESSAMEIRFYGSFAQTYKGHATDVAVVGGLLDYKTDDPRIPNAIDIAKERGIEVTFFKEEAIPDHPNTVRIGLSDEDGAMELVGVSIGGGAVQIIEMDGFNLRLSGEHPAILVHHRDEYGAVASVTRILMEYRINISRMEVSRIEKGDMALMTIETDQKIPKEVVDLIRREKSMVKVVVLNK